MIIRNTIKAEGDTYQVYDPWMKYNEDGTVTVIVSTARRTRQIWSATGHWDYKQAKAVQDRWIGEHKVQTSASPDRRNRRNRFVSDGSEFSVVKA